MEVLTVTQVNTYIKAVLDEIPPIKNIYICGEISNFKHYYQSGHMYFTLKDERSQMKAVMFAGDNFKLKFRPENGMKVICFGQIGVYERDGVYQLYCRDMHPQGTGSLTIAFEQLKEKLEKEGLFSAEYKKEIPKYPNKIGVATSNMGAAVEDIKNVLSRRYPLCDIVIVPTVVQGDSAAPDIVRSIEILDAMDDIDVIIVGRGGGSIEDLWAFNTEIVARAVFNCQTPIISAVGHETDYTICDFVADLRAPTPSAAAELAVPDIENEKIFSANLSASLDIAMNRLIEKYEYELKNISEKSVLADIDMFFDIQGNRLSDYHKKLLSEYKYVISQKEGFFKSCVSSLNALSPLAVLGRGYSIVTMNNSVVKRTADVKPDDKISIKVFDGSIKAVVKGATDGEGTKI